MPTISETATVVASANGMFFVMWRHAVLGLDDEYYVGRLTHEFATELARRINLVTELEGGRH
jgi:hypothetical protein